MLRIRRRFQRARSRAAGSTARSASRAASREISLSPRTSASVARPDTAPSSATRALAGPELVGDVIVAAEHGDPPHHVLELPHVARPVVAAEELEGRGAHGRRLPVLGDEATLEVLDERGNVLRPLAQRWDTDLDDVESIVEVLAEGASAEAPAGARPPRRGATCRRRRARSARACAPRRR